MLYIKSLISKIIYCSVCLILFMTISLPVFASDASTKTTVDLDNGEYSVDVTLTGGSGKASVMSPTLLLIQDGKAYATLTWSSSNYDYMIVDDIRYENESEEGSPSTFTIPVAAFDEELPVIADTTAMGTPHEIQYTLNFASDSIGSKSDLPQEAAMKVVYVALAIIVVGGILNHFVKKHYYE